MEVIHKPSRLTNQLQSTNRNLRQPLPNTSRAVRTNFGYYWSSQMGKSGGGKNDNSQSCRDCGKSCTPPCIVYGLAVFPIFNQWYVHTALAFTLTAFKWANLRSAAHSRTMLRSSEIQQSEIVRVSVYHAAQINIQTTSTTGWYWTLKSHRNIPFIGLPEYSFGRNRELQCQRS